MGYVRKPGRLQFFRRMFPHVSISYFGRVIRAKDIETSLWNKTIEKLLANGWEMTHQYDGMDAGIDYNSYTIEKAGEKIAFEWTNWDEGEIRCTEANLREIETLIDHRFTHIESIANPVPGTPQNEK